MPQTCTICRHKDREAIDQEILAGDPLRNIAEQFGISLTALHRHKQSDIPAALTQAKQAAEETQAETLFDRLRELNRETAAILREARALATRDNDLALKAIARAEKQLELEARLLGELNEEKKIAFGIAVQESAEPQWDFSGLTTDELLLWEKLWSKLKVVEQKKDPRRLHVTFVTPAGCVFR